MGGISDPFYVTLLVQGTGCVFLVLLFAALYWHYPRRYFLHWTLAWGCFALYLLAGAAYLRLRVEFVDPGFAGQLMARLSNAGNWLRGPLLLMGALEFLGRRRSRSSDYLFLIGLVVFVMLSTSFLGTWGDGRMGTVMRIPLPNAITGAALGFVGYAFFLAWRREGGEGPVLMAAASFLYAAQQLWYAVAALLAPPSAPIAVFSRYYSLFDTLLEVAIGVGMVFTLLEDEQRRSEALRQAQVETYKREAGLAAELRRIQRTAAQLTSAKPLDEMLEKIVQVISEACDASMIAILLLDEGGAGMRLGAAIGLPEPYRKALSSLPISQLWSNYSSDVMPDRDVVVVEDVRQDERWRPYIGIMDASGLRAAWAVPIVGRSGRLLAALAVYYPDPFRPTEAQIELARAYAHHAAVAIENSQLYQETERRLKKMEGLYEIAQSLGGFRASRAAIGSLADRVARLVNAAQCLVSTYDSRTGGIKPHLPGHNLNAGLVAAAANELDEPTLRSLWDFPGHGQLLANSVSELPEQLQPLARRFAVENLLAVDMVANEEVIGVIHVANKPGGFTEEDGKLVSIFASQAATVIQAEARLDKIYDVASRYQGQELFDRAALTLAELLEMSHVFIGQIEGAQQQARALGFCEHGAIRRIWGYELAGTASEAVIDQQQLISCAQGVQNLFPADQQVKSWGVESYIGAPIFNSRGEMVGIINACDQRKKDFTPTDSRILQIIGQRVGGELERQHGEDERRDLEMQLLQAQKMEAIGTLAGGIAHDFNNLLSGITGYTSLIKMQIAEDHPLFRAVTTIEQSADRAAALTKQLLGFARGGKYKVEIVNLNDVVERVRALISRTFDRAIEIHVSPRPDLWLVEADSGQIEQSLLNLAVNARDAMPGGGKLTISADNLTVGESYARRHLNLQPGRYVRLSVSDTGMGMDAVTQSRIFEPFFTTKEKGKGTGMGLAMVYGIIRNHGGHIEVQSEVGIGTTFRIHLPITDKKVGVESPLADSPIPKGSETLLVVDDEEVIRSLAEEALTQFGYTVLLANNGREALSLYEHQRDRIALVVLDMIMPELGGEATYQRLKQVNPSIKVLLSSGYSSTAQVQSLLNAGVAGFVQKPYQIRELAEAVRKALDDGGSPTDGGPRVSG